MNENGRMEIVVDFGRRSEKSDADAMLSPEGAAANPMARLFVGNPRKFDAMMDCFERLCSLGTEVGVEHAGSDDFICVASGNGTEGMILLMNAGNESIPVSLECKGMSPSRWQIIDACRTGTAIPPLAALPPASIVTVACVPQ